MYPTNNNNKIHQPFVKRSLRSSLSGSGRVGGGGGEQGKAEKTRSLEENQEMTTRSSNSSCSFLLCCHGDEARPCP